MNNITRTCELAAQAYLRTVGLSGLANASILAGFDDGVLVTPRVVCVSNRAGMDGPADDAVWNCELEIHVVSNADSRTQEQHHEMATEVFAQFFQGRTATAEALNTATDNFGCQDILPTGQSKEVRDREWRSICVFSVKCCGGFN